MRLLIFRIGQLGDTLVAVPALRVIRETYPDAEIWYLHDQHIRKPYVVSRTVLEGSGLVDAFVSYPVGYTTREKLLAVSKLALLWLRLKRLKFQKVICLQPERRSVRQLKRDERFFRSLGVDEVLSTASSRRIIPQPPFLEHQEHEADFFLRALSNEGICIDHSGLGDPSINITDLDHEAWKSVFPELDGSDKLRVAVGVGSKMQSKQWSLDSYREVLAELIETHDILPVFFGGPEDHEPSQSLMNSLSRGVNTCGHLSIRASTSLLSHCQMYLGNDTGTMHLAVAAGAPCVAVFSARDVPGKWYPYGEGHHVHRINVDCEGCMLTECTTQKKKCLTGIKPQHVLASCREILNHLPEG